MAHILIIGGGVAGLSAGIYACLAGHRATVCEQHAVPGGNLTGWERGGYHIDNCIHWLTGTNPATGTYRMWEDLGALGEDVEIYQGESLYTCERNGERLTLWRDFDRLERDMLALSPADARNIRSFCKTVRVIGALNGIGGASHAEKCTPPELLAALPSLRRHYKLTTGELAEQFHHPLLRDFITGVLGESFSSLALATVIASFCGENGGLPRGGSCAMAKRMAARLTSLGGELLLSKKAVQAIVAGNRVESVVFSDGSRIDADYVILAADPATLYCSLFSSPMPPHLQKIYTEGKGMRFSSWHCAFACDLPHAPFEGDLIFPISQAYRSSIGNDKLILREYAHESSWAPKGKCLLQSMVLCDEATACAFLKLSDDRAAYKKKKEELVATVTQILERKFPQLHGKLQALDIWTPATYRRYTGSETGSWMSFIFPAARLPHKTDNRDPSHENVLFATQWLCAPGGLPLAASEGKRAAKTLVKLCQKDARRKKDGHFRPAHA